METGLRWSQSEHTRKQRAFKRKVDNFPDKTNIMATKGVTLGDWCYVDCVDLRHGREADQTVALVKLQFHVNKLDGISSK